VLLAILIAFALAACSHSLIRIDTSSTRVSSVSPGMSVSTAGIRASTDSRLGAAIIVAVMLADGLRYFRLESDGTRTPIDAATARRLGVQRQVNIQDCTQPVDLTAGNLICR
jgi:hypothetical protein